VRGSASSVEFLRPADSAEALRLLEKHPAAVPLAGGTDFMVGFNAGLLNGKTVLDLSRIGEWSRIARSKDGLRIGALVTHSDLQRHAAAARLFPLLARACSTVGGVQIQNRGTLGGNIANASPAGDTFPALAVYEARVAVASASGRRLVPILELFAGVKKTTLARGELIEAIELPEAKKPTRQFFRKVGTRAAQAISKTVAAGLLWLEGGRVRELRFALGSMAPTVRRLRTVEAFASGKRLDAGTIDAACRVLEQDVSPIDDIRSTREYRLEVSRRMLKAFLTGRP
jgi:CO/xanthine dehydrogenase FAD-binding subunit